MCCFATRALSPARLPPSRVSSGWRHPTEFERKPRHPARNPKREELPAMAIFHLTAKIISRGKGQSAIAAAAYRSGERLRDEQAGEQKFYQTRAERIEFTEIMAPKDAPEWAYDRNQLWNEAERAEKRKDAQLAREIEVALPHELTHEQRVWLVKDFAREAFVRKGYAVDIAIHAPDKESDERNHHAHIMVTRRTLGADGFAATKDWKRNPQELAEWREKWAHLANRHLERHGHDARIDHRSLKEQGIDREAGVHLGYAANEMAQRGAQSDRMDRLKGVMERNDIRLELSALDREVAALEQQQQALAKARSFAQDREALERLAALQKLEKAAKADERKLWSPKGEVSPERELGDGIRAAVRQERRDTQFWGQQEAWRASVDEQKSKVATPDVAKPVEAGLQVADKATGAVMGLADFMSNLVSGHTEKPPPEKREGEIAGFIHDDPKLRKEQQLARYAAVKAEREADKALERIEDDMKQGRSLSSSDIQNLTRAHQDTLRHFGDDGMRQLIEEMRKRNERQWRSDGRERD